MFSVGVIFGHRFHVRIRVRVSDRVRGSFGFRVGLGLYFIWGLCIGLCSIL